MPDFNPDDPAISWTNFMSGQEEADATHLVGPYPTIAARDADLARIRALPLGAPEYNGGALFHAGTMAEANGAVGWDLFMCPPSQVAGARTLRGFFAAFSGDQEEVRVTSFGYGHDPAYAAELVVDVRETLRNPHHDPAMHGLTGEDPRVREHVMATPGAAELVADIVGKILNGEVSTVAIGCVGGRHRSVALADAIGALLTAKGREVEVYHRDVDMPILPARAHEGAARG